MERTTTNDIRRRRLIGLAGAAIVAGICIATNAWQYSPIKWMLEWDEVRHGTFVAGDPYDEWIYSYCDGDSQQVAVLVNDRIEGVSGLDALHHTKLGTRCDLPLADHPDLEEWQHQLQQLNKLTVQHADNASEIVASALAFPISAFYLKPLKAWINSDQENAVAFIDALASARIDFNNGIPDYEQAQRDSLASLIELALTQVPTTELDNTHVQRWLSSNVLSHDGKVLMTLASLSNTPAAVKVQLLNELKNVARSQRTEYYLALAAPLVRDSQYTTLVVQQLRNLSNRERLGAVRRLLAEADISTTFTSQLLRNLDDVFHGNETELEAFIAISNQMKSNPDAPRLLAATLEDLADLERRKAAIHMLSLDAPGQTDYAMNVLLKFDKLHPQSKPKVMDALLSSAQFRDKTVQETCLDVILFEIKGGDQRELLSKMMHHHALDGEVESRLRIAASGLAENS